MDIMLNCRGIIDDQIDDIRDYNPIFYASMSQLKRVGDYEDEIVESFEICEKLQRDFYDIQKLNKSLEALGMSSYDVSIINNLILQLGILNKILDKNSDSILTKREKQVKVNFDVYKKLGDIEDYLEDLVSSRLFHSLNLFEVDN